MMATRLPPRAASGRFKKLPRRRNLEGKVWDGKFHPYRRSEDYDPTLAGDRTLADEKGADPWNRHKYSTRYRQEGPKLRTKYVPGKKYKPVTLAERTKRERARGDQTAKYKTEHLQEARMAENRRGMYGMARNPKTGQFVKAAKRDKKK